MSMTVKQFIESLRRYPGDWELTFGVLDFYQLKKRGETRVNVEFNQSIWRDGSGKLRIDDLDLADDSKRD